MSDAKGEPDFDEQEFTKTFDAYHQMAMRDVSEKIRAKAHELAQQPEYYILTAVVFAHAEFINMGGLTKNLRLIPLSQVHQHIGVAGEI